MALTASGSNASGVVGLSTAISSRVPMRATLNGVFSPAPRQIRSARRNYASEAFRQRHFRPPHLTNSSPGPLQPPALALRFAWQKFAIYCPTQARRRAISNPTATRGP